MGTLSQLDVVLLVVPTRSMTPIVIKATPKRTKHGILLYDLKNGGTTKVKVAGPSSISSGDLLEGPGIYMN